MIEILTGFPPSVAALKATGKINKKDYEDILIPAVERVAKSFGKINFLFELDTDVINYSIGAWIDKCTIGHKTCYSLE